MLFVNEIFASLQGEATFAGTPSVFIRFQGCNCQCEWCDTKYTWKLGKPNDKPIAFALQKQDAPRYCTTTADELFQTIRQKYPNIRHIVMTGGEPMLQDIGGLCDKFIRDGLSVQVETSGTALTWLPKGVFVTVSPKVEQAGKRVVCGEMLARANEIKMPVATDRDIENLKFLIDDGMDCPIYLQPISQGKEATELCIKACMEHGWRLSLQVHKFIGLR